MEHQGFAVDRPNSRLYLLRNSSAQQELYLFDQRSRQFRPFLSGVSAYDVDFSRDGSRISYVRQPSYSLWVSAADGSSPKEIHVPNFEDMELPRWSPNGTQIAFMAKFQDQPYRIFIADLAGHIRQAGIGTDNQGAPTWSPDGRFLVAGRVLCQEENTCLIEQIDLSTGRQTVLPGSEGLSTARSSPNGRFVAALRPVTHEVWLLDRRTGKWRTIAQGVNGNDLAWSPDSHTVYASRPNGNRPDVIGIDIRNLAVETIIDLSEFSKLPGRIEPWFAVAPNGSIVFVRDSNGQEIYAYHYSE